MVNKHTRREQMQQIKNFLKDPVSVLGTLSLCLLIATVLIVVKTSNSLEEYFVLLPLSILFGTLIFSWPKNRIFGERDS